MALKALALRALGADPGAMLDRLDPRARRTHRPPRELDDLERARAARGRSNGSEGDRPLPHPPAAPLRRLVVACAGRTRLERHGRRDPGAPGDGEAGEAIARGLAYLRRLQRKDGGFALVEGRASDSQSTAWAIQAFVAAGKKPPAAAFRFLGRMRRPDGSYRYSARYAVTPVWVTAQVLPALARKPFPLK